MPCGLLKFDLECGDFQAFQDEVHKWENDPLFMDRLFAAFGRFHTPSHQVQHPPINLFYLLDALVLQFVIFPVGLQFVLFVSLRIYPLCLLFYVHIQLVHRRSS
jgi:hypothetical protein